MENNVNGQNENSEKTNVINANLCSNNKINNNVITKIMGLNICGFRSKINNGIFDEYAKNYDVLCLSETKVSKISDVDLKDSSLSDYHCYSKDKTISEHQYGGVHGLCMLVRNNLSKHTELISGVCSPYVLWVKFSEKAFGVSCIIGSIYLSGENPLTKTKKCLTQ